MAYRIKLDGLDIECDTLEEMWAAKTFALSRTGGVTPAVDRDINPENLAGEQILAAVARAGDVTVKAIAGRSRLPAIVLPRQVACYLLRKVNGLTYQAIGRLVARDHTTVMAACDSIVGQLEREPEGAAAKLIGRSLDVLALERAAGIATTLTGSGPR